MSAARCALAAGAALGESPVWSVQEQVLYWIDMGAWEERGVAPTLNRFDPSTGDNRRWPLPEAVGCFALREGGAILALQSGIHDFDFARDQLQLLAPSNFSSPLLRFNDGRCDRQGRFWSGQAQQIGPGIARGLGALTRYDGRTLETRLGGITVSNGLAFSPDGRTLYYADVLQWRVYACDYDTERGEPGEPRVFLQFPEGIVPDGAAVDEEGGYWIALYKAGKVARYLPSGQLDREITLPVSCPTMVAFGGPDLRTLYITTASHRLSETERTQQPLAGAIFSCEPGVRGLPEPLFQPGAP
jgi:L-arabinonolactonase